MLRAQDIFKITEFRLEGVVSAINDRGEAIDQDSV